MLSPARTRYRKTQKGRMRGYSKGNNFFVCENGNVALLSSGRGWLTARQIEAARIALSRKLKRGGKIRIRVFPDKPITRKPAEVRMGKGKGGVEEWAAVVRPGQILYEVEGVSDALAARAMHLAAAKLPFSTRVLMRSQEL